MERARLERPVSEVELADVVRSLVPESVSEPHAQRDVATDDPVAAPKAAVDGEQVHRATLATTYPVPATVKLSHDRPRIAPQQQRVSVITIAGDHLVPIPDPRQEAGGHGLLASVQVHVAANRALPKRPLTGLLEHPNEHHLAVKIDQALAAGAHSTVAGLGVALPVGAFWCLRHQRQPTRPPVLSIDASSPSIPVSCSSRSPDPDPDARPNAVTR